MIKVRQKVQLLQSYVTYFQLVLQQPSLITPALAKLSITGDNAIKQQDQISRKCFVILLKWNTIFLPMYWSGHVGHQSQKPLKFK